MQLKLSSERIRILLDVDPLQLPPYTSQILNLANQNAHGTRPKVVGQMSELIQEFDGRTLEEWEKWYMERHKAGLKIATEKIRGMVDKLKTAVMQITDEMIEQWVHDLVIVKTYVGLRFQEAVLQEIAGRLNTTYQVAAPEDEAQGVDGYINGRPLSIKPVSYKVKATLQEKLPACMIYYEKVNNDLLIEFNEAELQKA